MHFKGYLSIGTRIENKFLDLLELAYIAYFSEKKKKLERVIKCISILDALKFLIYISWEVKFISNKAYEDLVLKLNDIGKMFGGWRKNLEALEKKNPA